MKFLQRYNIPADNLSNVPTIVPASGLKHRVVLERTPGRFIPDKRVFQVGFRNFFSNSRSRSVICGEGMLHMRMTSSGLQV